MTKTIFLSFFLCFSLITSIGCCDKLSQHSIIYRDTLYLTKYDTVTVFGKADIIYKTDTIIKTYPFTAKKDTIVRYIVNNRVKYDTISFKYDFPTHDFWVRFSKEIDTLKQVNTEVKTTFEKKPTFWEKIQEYLIYLVLIIIGIGIGRIIK